MGKCLVLWTDGQPSEFRGDGALLAEGHDVKEAREEVSPASKYHKRGRYVSSGRVSTPLTLALGFGFGPRA